MDINKLSNKIIGSAIEVLKGLGPGLLESIYEECLCYEFDIRKISYDRQVVLPVKYKDKKFSGGYRLDILVEDSIILEFKAVDNVEAIHKAQLLAYLKLSGIKLGLIINFNVPVLKDGIVRVVNELAE